MDDMGNRVAQRKKTQRINSRGLSLEFGLKGTTLWSGFRGRPWPVVARRLDLMGQLRAIKYSSGRVVMVTNSDPEDIVSSLGGHRTPAKARISNWWLPILIPVLGALCLVPLGSHKAPVINKRNGAVNPCSVTSIENWLTGNSNNPSKIKMLDSSVLGGVTSGLLECDGVRYSYALGSKEPKRVLNFRKLDS